MADVLTFTDRGIYCPAGDFYIDPWKSVPRALITHGHSDHARRGMGHYLCTDIAAPVIRHRLGKISLDTIPYGQTRRIGDAMVSFHPAGHTPGSAQIRVEVAGQVWVASGDYKTTPDGLSTAFEPVKCHAFITESTFGLPIFNWTDPETLLNQINTWWAANAAAGRPSVLGAYSLGKAQRLLKMVNPDIGPLFTHSSIEATNQILRTQGINLPPTTQLTDAAPPPNALVLAPPGTMAGFGPNASTAFASGWMALRNMRRSRGGDKGFVVSDHADWAGLNAAIAATGANRIFVTHGYTRQFTRYLREQGYDAHIVSTDYQGESPEAQTTDAGLINE